MTSDHLHTKQLLASLDETTSRFVEMVSSFDESEINTIPFKNSWTAAQVADHVTKSNMSVIQSLQVPGQSSQRSPDERAEELKVLFLNFSKKLQSPDFILPSRDIYDREKLLVNLEDSVLEIKHLAQTVNLFETLNHRAFGDITKLEVLHFVIYHTQRHIHQLSKIGNSVQNSISKK